MRTRYSSQLVNEGNSCQDDLKLTRFIMFRRQLNKFRLVQFCWLFALKVTGLLSSNVDPSEKRFINLSADCASLVPNGTIEVTLHTSEPFFGSLYSRDYPSSCKSVGEGSVSTKLIVKLGSECGVQTISQRAGKLVATSEKVNHFLHIFFELIE